MERPEPGAAAVGGTGLWCELCNGPVRRDCGLLVHAATGQDEGPDGHQAVPSAIDPALKTEAAQIQADYSGLFRLTAEPGFLRAEWTQTRPGITPVHYEAENGSKMRRELDAALSSAALRTGIAAGRRRQ